MCAINSKFRQRLCAASLLLLFGLASVNINVNATDLANDPLVTSGGVSVAKPNIAFVVDDSGSMAYESMPADDSDFSNIRNKRCFGWYKHNTVFYNPSYTYKPPYKIDGTVYSDGVRRFNDASFTAVLKDGYFPLNGYTFDGNATSNTSVNLSILSNLTPQSVSCTASSRAVAKLTVTGNDNTSVSNVTVNGVSIWSGGATNDNTSRDTVASRIAAQITAGGYSATVNGNVVTIHAPNSAGNLTVQPVVTKAYGGMAIAATNFSGFIQGECDSGSSRYYYSTHKTNANSSTCETDSNYSIVTRPEDIAAPGVATGSDAAKTNYANWYSYYRKRGSALKMATGEAFKDLDESKYRAGLFFINSANSSSTANPKPNSDLKIVDFSGSASGTQRYDWYSRLYGHRASGYTPLRGALSRMGRMYAGRLSGWDPVQYSCQQNFTILSTDGYWNDGDDDDYGPKQLDGETNVGHTDHAGSAAAPARATISISDATGGRNRDPNACYKITSLTINNGTLVELLNPAHAIKTNAGCQSSKDDIGAAIAQAINQYTATTGFSASYSSRNEEVTITAPEHAGSLSTISPVISPEVVSGVKTRTFQPSRFSGYVVAEEGYAPPIRDDLELEDTLADVALYYYKTDLRDTSYCTNTIDGVRYEGLCKNDVKGSGKDTQTQQHMTTYTLGLGVSGSILYQNNYETAGDVSSLNTYYDIVNNGLDWPNPTTANAHKIDDLWHAAVNGHGIYYSASDASTLKAGIQGALSGIQAQKGAASAAATSNIQPVEGDNFVYVALYHTVDWYGDLLAYEMDPTTKIISDTKLWSAKDELDTKIRNADAGADGRSIKYFYKTANGAVSLKEFNHDNLNTDSLLSNFQDICAKSPRIDQCGNDGDDLTDAQKIVANNANNLINYLRGQGTYENETSNSVANRVYRGRLHVLGDIVNASPVYMKRSLFSYGTYDDSYNTFKAGTASRAATVFVAANDGMLHAFDATNGQERWAYIPRFVMPNLWTLADRNYGNNHRYSVDGSPTVADICADLDSENAELCKVNANNTTNWKTILVGGLNKGGCGYYALDVTNPADPKALWEFTHANLGYAYGKPVVVKNKEGKWVVIVSSGYNNYPENGCGSTGDGNGHIFVIDAVTGELLNDIPTNIDVNTPAGTTDNPSGLSKLNVWINDTARPIADRVYAGDLFGNVWRIDFDDNYAPNNSREAKRIAQLKDGLSEPQPVTTRPELAKIRFGAQTIPVVLIGTGKFLGTSDKSTTQRQTIYAFKDDPTVSSGIANVRGNTMRARILTQTTGSTGSRFEGRAIRTIGGDPVNWGSDEGWYMDLDPNNRSPGERVNIDMLLRPGTLVAAGNVPDLSACKPGGYAWLYFIDLDTGLALPSAVDGAAGVQQDDWIVGLGNSQDGVVKTSSEGEPEFEEPFGKEGGGGVSGARRTTWREILD